MSLSDWRKGKRNYSLKTLVGADPGALELFRFYCILKDQSHDDPIALVMLLGTAVHAPEFFGEQPVSKAPEGKMVQLPRDSLFWGGDFLVRNLVRVRGCLGQQDVGSRLRDTDLFLNLVLPQLAHQIKGSDAYRSVLGVILNLAIAKLLGSKFVALPADKIEPMLANILATLQQDFLRDELYRAANDGREADVKRLLDKGADPNSKNDDGVAALHTAALAGHTGVVKELLACGADVDPRNAQAATPLHGACLQRHTEVVGLLLASGANANAKLDDGGTPLHVSAEGSYQEAAELLLSSGADPNTRDMNEVTPLHVAVAEGCKPLVKLLIDGGSDVSARDKYGVTPLHLAVVKHGDDKQLIGLLVDSNADVNAKDNKGSSPLMFAQAKKYEGIVEIMRQKSAKQPHHPRNPSEMTIETTVHSVDGTSYGLPEGFDIIDTRTPEYQETQRDAMSGKSLGSEVDRLVQELITIGRSDGFEAEKERTRRIGMRINEIGGFSLMQAAALKALAVLGARYERDLEWGWHGIGQWQR